MKANDGLTFIPVGLTETDDDGKYLLTGIADRRIPHRGRAQHARPRIGHRRGRGGRHPRPDIDIVIGNDGYGTVRGVVRFPDGAPAGDVVVSVDGRGVLTGPDGTFELPELLVKPTHAADRRAQSRDGLRDRPRRCAHQPAEPGAARTSSSRSPASARSNSPSSTPITTRSPTRRSISSATAPIPAAARRRTRTRRARCTFTTIPSATSHARATARRATSWDQADARSRCTSDGATAFGVLIFPGAGTVTGTVLNPDNTPALGADVILRAKVFDPRLLQSRPPGMAQRVRTDSQGKFRFTGVNVGTVSVTVDAPVLHYVDRRRRARSPRTAARSTSRRCSLVNTISGELSGTVYLPDGITPAGAGVEVTAVGPLPDVTVTTTRRAASGSRRSSPAATTR